MTYFKLANYSLFALIDISLWSVKDLETYAIEIDAAKDDLMIIHVIKYREKILKNSRAQ